MPDKAKTLLFSVLLLPATAMATTGNAEQQNTQQIRIEQIQEETALYEAMLAREKIRHELRTLEQGVPAEAGRPQESTSAIPTAPSTAASPRLTEIFGVQPQLSARIELSGGHITDVKTGQNIPGTTYHVEKITPDSVVLEQSGTRKTLRP
ncbi:type IV pilus biogenesis protein PilP [Escherichia coli]|nr:type IV pilus biogenesis protein PilP [Escherichia coli]EFD4218518.1 type IV pilus biogenesis protein PilP [Escherichia coli]